MEKINVFFLALQKAYNQQGQTGRIVIPGLLAFIFCCLCSIPSIFVSSRNSGDVTPSPVVLPTQGTQATPTALFDFDFFTFTPFPTLPAPTAFPTLTPLSTETLSPTLPIPTATLTPLPTNTATLVPPTATPTRGPAVIVAVNKASEYVEIQNLSRAPVNLRGWRLVSELGDQSCELRGTLDPNEVLRIWSRRGSPGFDCRFSGNIWRDNEVDPAVLYNPQGEEISRYP